MNIKYSGKTFFVFVLLVQFCFGQKVFKLTEGKAVFINPNLGVVIQKEDKYYSYKIYIDSDKKGTGFRKELDEVSFLKFSELLKNPNNIFPNQIVNYDFKDLKNKKFLLEKGGINYEFFQFNNEYFALFCKARKFEYTAYPVGLNTCFTYYILDLGNNQKIICSFSNFENSFLIPIKNKMMIWVPFLDKDYSEVKSFDYQKIITEEIKVNAWQLYAFYDKVGFDSEFYRIDTLKNKKVRIINSLKQPVFKKEYDSIKINRFIVCYKKGFIDLYNPTFKKFDFENVKAIIEHRYNYTAQIIKGNELRTIDISGNQDEIAHYSFVCQDNLESDWLTNIFLTKENDRFYVYSDENTIMAEQYVDPNQKIALKDDLGIQAIYFHSNSNNDKFKSARGVQNDFYVYCKMKSGKYNIYNLNFLLPLKNSENLAYYNVRNLPVDLESVEGINYKGLFKIKKNSLVGYFPINKEPKYKILEDFQENFARFEFPNGQKGWLDLNGNEYLDN